MPGMGRVFGRPREPSNKLSKRNPKRRGGVQKPVSVSRFRGSKVAHRPAARRRTLSVPSVLASRAAGIAAAPLHVSCFAGRYPLHPGLAIAGFAGWLACWLAGRMGCRLESRWWLGRTGPALEEKAVESNNNPAGLCRARRRGALRRILAGKGLGDVGKKTHVYTYAWARCAPALNWVQKEVGFCVTLASVLCFVRNARER